MSVKIWVYVYLDRPDEEGIEQGSNCEVSKTREARTLSSTEIKCITR